MVNGDDGSDKVRNNGVTMHLTQRINVALVQINANYAGQSYLPYSIGLLQAYAQSNASDPSRYVFLPQLYTRVPLGQAVSRIREADVAGFSLYVWNNQYTLELARRLKRERPRTLIVFGGPHVPDDTEPFLRRNPFIDVAVRKEGEPTFLRLLEAFPDSEWRDIPGISYIDPNGVFVAAPPSPRIRDLEDLPSPFLSGVFDRIMSENPEVEWIGLWETNRGCPFSCTFCDWGSATAAKVNKYSLDRLHREIDWFAQKKTRFIFCCDANFGILKRDVEIAKKLAEVKRVTGYPDAISVQNTKNARERAYETQKILSDAGLNHGVAIAMQSMNPETLLVVKRDNISLEAYLELQRRFMADGIDTYTDLILGLPGETYESWCEGISRIIEGGQHNHIIVNNLVLLPNTELAQPEQRSAHGLQTVMSDIIQIHGQRVVIDDDVNEIQETVIATRSMPHNDWIEARAFAWMALTLHFNKLFNIPNIVAHELTGVRYRQIFERFLNADAKDFPIVAGIARFFRRQAKAIQQGDVEYVYSKDWLDIYWPANEYVFIRLTAENLWHAFYAEGRVLIEAAIVEHGAKVPSAALDDAVAINRALMKQPFLSDAITIKCSTDILPFWQAARRRQPQPLSIRPTDYVIDRSKEHWDDLQVWCREVVWYGAKRGAYMYGHRALQIQYAGIH